MCKNKLYSTILTLLLLSLTACQSTAVPTDDSQNTATANQPTVTVTLTPTPTPVPEPTYTPTPTPKPTCTPTPTVHILEQGEWQTFGDHELNLPKGSITTEDSILRTKHLELHIPKNVYIMGDLTEKLDIITSTMEEVSGMKFEGNPHYIKGLTQVQVEKPDGNEFGSAYAFYAGATLSSGDILDLYALIHECSHVLHYNQSNWSFCQWAMEGISTYTTYKTQKYLEEHYPSLVEVSGPSVNSLMNFEIYDYEKLYEHSMEYWIDNVFEYSGNVNYSIGFRFMWYLDTVYGDYTKWIYAYEESNPYYKSNTGTDQVPSEVHPDVFQSVYGETVFEDFYAWLKENEELFQIIPNVLDYTDAEPFNLYPRCYWYGDDFRCLGLSMYNSLLYNDLYIGLDAAKTYLTDYIGREYTSLQLTINSDVTIRLYGAGGELLQTYEADSNSNLRKIDVTDAAFVELVGEGILTKFSINIIN